MNAIERVFREEHGRILATLIRQCGDFDLAEESLQDAFITALEHWPRDGTPANPAAWLLTTARRRVIDRIRRDKRFAEKLPLLEAEAASAATETSESMHEIPDDRLRLIFTCCHPALAPEAQVALTLRTLGGLTTAEVARAFLVTEATMAQRLVRVKRKIRETNIPYEVPPAHCPPERLDSVLGVLYLVFNEGYASTAGDSLIRRELCAEAIRLCRILCGLMPDEPEALGLLALMLLHHSRRNARASSGDLVPLEEQDRDKWHHDEIAEGAALVQQALRMRRAGPYQVQAAIAALHCEARRAEHTDWARIAALYSELLRLDPTPVVALNHAIAVAMAGGPEDGLALLDGRELAESLDSYHLYHAARADLLRRAARDLEAAEAYSRALALTSNDVERRYLARRLSEVSRK